jgi:hypothetical protein
MVIRAKYDGRCAVCGQRIRAGAEIEWSRDAGATHLACVKREEKQAETVAAYDGPTYALRAGSHGGEFAGWAVGDVVRATAQEIAKGYPEWLFVLRAARRYVREDGLSFGVGSDSGYLYNATCRAATEAEAAPAIALRAEREAAKAAKAAREVAARELEALCRAGERVGDDNVDLPAGERITVREGVQGSGREIVVLGADGSVSWWCSGHYDDYRRSCWRTADARAVELAQALRTGM